MVEEGRSDATQSPASWLDVATSDAQDAASIQQQWMQIQYDQIDRGDFAGRFRMLRTPGTLVVNELQNRTVLKQQYSPVDYCTISVIRKVSGRGRCGLDALSGRTVGYMPGDSDYEVQLPASEILYVGFNQTRLLQAADVLGLDVPGRGQRALFLDGLDAPGLSAMAETLLSLQQTRAGHSLDSVHHDYLDQVVLERALEILLEAPARATRLHTIGAHRITQRARELIEGSPHEPWTVMMLCQALHASRGTLQRAFMQIYGISPLAFLRLRRLNGARRALQAGRDTGTTVASIAMHWGFFHLSRFSRDYLRQFGELPSVTLGSRPTP